MVLHIHYMNHKRTSKTSNFNTVTRYKINIQKINYSSYYWCKYGHQNYKYIYKRDSWLVANNTGSSTSVTTQRVGVGKIGREIQKKTCMYTYCCWFTNLLLRQKLHNIASSILQLKNKYTSLKERKENISFYLLFNLLCMSILV